MMPSDRAPGGSPPSPDIAAALQHLEQQLQQHLQQQQQQQQQQQAPSLTTTLPIAIPQPIPTTTVPPVLSIPPLPGTKPPTLLAFNDSSGGGGTATHSSSGGGGGTPSISSSLGGSTPNPVEATSSPFALKTQDPQTRDHSGGSTVSTGEDWGRNRISFDENQRTRLSGGSYSSARGGSQYQSSPPSQLSPPQSQYILHAGLPVGYHMAAQWPGSPTAIHQQQQIVADAARQARQVAVQKTLEQQQLAARQAASSAAATMPAEPTQHAAAVVQALQDQAALDTATSEAQAAQSVASSLQQQAAVLKAATTLQSAPSPQGVLATSTPVHSAVTPLLQAAATAKQTAVQKQIEQQAAAATYQSAATQAATASEPAQAAIAKAVAEHAAAVYHQSGNEAANAAAAAAHLEHQAATATAALISLHNTPIIPASAPLEASIAAGAPLRSSANAAPAGAGLLGAQHGALTPPSLTTNTAGVVSPSLIGSPLPTSTFYQSSATPSPTLISPGLSGLSQPPGVLTTPPLATTHQQQQLMQAAALASLGVTHHPLTTTTAAVPQDYHQFTMNEPTATSISSRTTTTGSANTPSLWMPSGALSSLGLSEYPPTSTALSPPPSSSHYYQQQQQQKRPPPQQQQQQPAVIKAVCSSGGSFVRGMSGSWDYEGGETRLVNIPFGCSAEVLFGALERATSSLSTSSGGLPSDYNPILKYRLPSDPNVFIDLMDDDDVDLMFDEWQEALGASSSGGSGASAASTPPKLHIYVQWRDGEAISTGGSGIVPPKEEDDNDDEAPPPPPPPNSPPNEPDQQQQQNAELQQAPSQALQSPFAAAPTPPPSEPNSRNNSLAKTPQSPHSTATTTRRNKRNKNKLRVAPSSTIHLPDLMERMEIISPTDITLTRFLGSGGYGDVYLGRWHGCEVAVKCLNPSLFFQGGGEGASRINRAAVVDLIKEADVLGSLRHPNCVWVYGMVLPQSTNDGSPAGVGSADDGDDFHPQDIVDAIEAEAGAPSMMPGVLRPPALVTEYMAGGSLRNALARKADIVAGTLTRLVLALDAAKGLEYLHSKKLVHFDVKVANLLLGYRDRRPVCKVADFGLAREKSQTFVSGVTSQRGTLPWTAPEIIRTPHSVDEKVDVYSFGIVLWSLWSGQPEPYEGLNYHSLVMQLANPEVKLRPPIPGTPEWEGSPESAPPEPAPGYRHLMERCWSENPSERPPFTESVKELRGMIAAVRPSKCLNTVKEGTGRLHRGSSALTSPPPPAAVLQAGAATPAAAPDV